jgi:phosphatidylethanolamine/phosphatidyl-N-methylethanolamine N-methyltransferase
MEIKAVLASYRRWAPIYDETFGAFTRIGRRRVVEHINRGHGSVLEVGVGTGLSLGKYAAHLEITGVDVSAEMLAKARAKVAKHRLTHIVELREMDARELDFPDGSFDTVVAMFLVSVVPEPEKVVSEMARVCKPGGEVLIVNHFARNSGALAMAERAAAPFADLLGWHSDFPMDRVLGERSLVLEDTQPLPPIGMFTFLRQRKRETV